MIPSRRHFILGASATLITAPAVVRAASLMPVKVMPTEDALQALLAKRIAEAERLTREWMTYALYGDPQKPSTFMLTYDSAEAEKWPHKQVAFSTQFRFVDKS